MVKLETNGYNSVTAMWCARFADLVYENEEECRWRIEVLDGSVVGWWSEGNAQGFAALFGETIVIAIRGTEPDQIRDLISDARIAMQDGPFKVGDKIHKGFYSYAMKLWLPIVRLMNQFSEKSFILCGHSLGAAAAVLLASKMVKIDKLRALYTYGCPRVGNKIFAKILDYEIKEKHFRHYNGCDIVARIPWAPRYYRHCGSSKYFVKNGRMLDAPRFWRVFLNRLLIFCLSPWSWIKHGLTDHSRKGYMRLTLGQIV